jgi:hypothetical protein
MQFKYGLAICFAYASGGEGGILLVQIISIPAVGGLFEVSYALILPLPQLMEFSRLQFMHIFIQNRLPFF